jgi:hypothetical protein
MPGRRNEMFALWFLSRSADEEIGTRRPAAVEGVLGKGSVRGMDGYSFFRF